MKVRGLVKEFGDLTAVNKVNFTMYNGQIFALFVIAIAAAEVAIALAVFLSLYNQRDTIELDLLNRLRF